MKKTSIKWDSLQGRIDAFQKSPLGQLKKQLKGEDEKLRKVSRNRLLRRQPSLPYLYQQQKENKENNPVECRVIKTTDETKRVANRQSSHSKGFNPNRSFLKTKTINIEHNIQKYPSNYDQFPSKKVLVRKSSHPQFQAQHMKDTLLNQQVFIRSKNSLPSRQCMSAQVKNHQNTPNQPPLKLRQFRRALHRKRSNDKIQTNDLNESKHIPLLLQAQRLAYEGRSRVVEQRTSEEGGKSKAGKFFALEDFLNEWKQINLK